MKEKITDEYITVMMLGSGAAAVHMVKVEDEHGAYWDVQQTGIGRYPKASDRYKAEKEAEGWALAEGIPYRT